MSRLSAVSPFVPGAVRLLVGAGAAAGVVWAAGAVPGGLDLAAATGAREAAPVATSLATSVDTMCPGNELSGIPGVDPVPVGGRVVAASGPADLLPVPAAGSGSAVLTGGSTRLGAVAAQRPGRVEAALPRGGPVELRAAGALAPAVAATQEWLLRTTDLRGLVTTPCRSAASDLWLLGGGDGPGRQERLVLLNPGGNPVTADVSVHGAQGQVGETRTETVAPGGRTTLLLDAVAPEEAMPAVHVVADGGGLAATLTDTWITGSTARGSETVTPGATPGTVQVVPAAVVAGPARLRVAVPGAEQAVASVTLLDADGEVTTTADTVLTVAGGAVGELALPTVPPGTYTVVVRSDVPVVAAAVGTVGSATGLSDLGWSVSAPVVDDVAGIALPSTPTVGRTLRLVSTGGASTATVSFVVGGEVRTRDVDLLSERTTDVDLPGATAVWVQRGSGSGALRGALVSRSGAGVSQVVSVVPLEPVAVTSPVSRAFPQP